MTRAEDVKVGDRVRWLGTVATVTSIRPSAYNHGYVITFDRNASISDARIVEVIK